MLAQATTVDPGAAWLWAVVGSGVPVALWLVFFYTRDRYDREPKRLIAGLFFIGAIPVAILAGIVNTAMAAIVGGLVVAVVVAPIGEELLKYLGARIPTRKHPAFDEPIDGMIYGSTVGLGFAFAENIDYLFAGYAGIPLWGDELLCEPGFDCFLELAIIRGLLTALLHALATGIAGYYLAQHVLGRQTGRVERRGLLYAILIHAAWNAGFLLALGIAAVAYAVLSRRALAASPHRLQQVDDAHHWIEHFAVGDGLLAPCQHCGALHHPGQRFCTVCGAQLLEAGVPHAVGCPSCGQPQPVTSNFCTACGSRLPRATGVAGPPP